MQLKKQRRDITNNLKTLTHQKLMKMVFLEFNKRLWLVFDPKSNKYMAFDGHTNQGYYTSSFQQAKRQFIKLGRYYKS